ncbi:hypothetical protein H257_05711 [Aphanomyces astaci]|uniref:Uncharacterized protein n=1 Tax=Aphanomyces astaci TaxID=112090 RepID=W4GQG5_APHAT|nr:hypothetical protein H257_05711 [Aphanomyces astaci]ETV81108.1 hypothetical protein H257_05711 [Aphanomyces astaci]|eukprot:XP_009828966.1 hypothetical protein H257_05711 [Aphanomyces astaci]
MNQRSAQARTARKEPLKPNRTSGDRIEDATDPSQHPHPARQRKSASIYDYRSHSAAL